MPHLPVSSHKALAYQILHVALSSEPLPECPNYSPGVKLGPTPGATSFTWTYKGKPLEISLYLAIKPRATNVALSSGPSRKGVNYNPRVKLIAKSYKFYIVSCGEVFRNLLGALQKNYGYQF